VAVDGVELSAQYGRWAVDLAEMSERYLNNCARHCQFVSLWKSAKQATGICRQPLCHVECSVRRGLRHRACMQREAESAGRKHIRAGMPTD
jgi:hypothetical protein